MHKKYHKKFKILDILAVTTQARESIETTAWENIRQAVTVTTQARESIETRHLSANNAVPEESNNSSP